ncbi:copper transporter, putative [Plasmodium vinckei brucechwatti]|uniref:Copper transport protein n=1 Tax=Plasmodium vinckei brucechwatti TaxID=119398 RepID=A0A6V7SNR2_PLAVN|nr:copper transporter, putative [Plasmodium vinckei brucechwatti]
MCKNIWKIIYIVLIINALFLVNINCESNDKNNGDDNNKKKKGCCGGTNKPLPSPNKPLKSCCSSKKSGNDECKPILDLNHIGSNGKNKIPFIYQCCANHDAYESIINKHFNEENGDNTTDTAEKMNMMMSNLSMPMSFQNTTHTIILFKFWETTTVPFYFISLILCFMFGILSVAFKVLRLYIEKALPTTSNANIFTSATLFKHNTIRMILSFIIYSWDYLLMLIVMTFNVGLFFAVILGLSFGYFLMGNNFVSCTQDSNCDVDAHKELYGDPACCGC